jgi:ribonuclease-3
VLTQLSTAPVHNKDYKTVLQEKVQQKRNQTIVYTLVGESGPDHDKHFEVELLLTGQVIGRGVGSSKKRAEQDAARAALENM